MTRYLARKILATTIGAVAVLATGAFAGDVFIPNSTYSGGCNVIPMNGGWPSSSNSVGEWRYQTHLKAAAIGQSGYITDMAFLNCTGGQVLTATGFEVRMSHTTLTRPVSTFATNLPNPVVVYPSGPFTYTTTAQTWTPIGLTNGFFYNGRDDLTIEIRYQTGSVTGGNLACDTQSSVANAPFRTYVYGPGSYNATTASATASTAGLKVRLTIADVQITPNGSPRVGMPFSFQLFAPGEVGKAFQAASSLGQGPIAIGPRSIPLSPDNLFATSVGGALPSVFAQYAGFLSAAGGGTVRINIPNIAALVGVTFYTAYIVLDPAAPQGISAISANASVMIQP